MEYQVGKTYLQLDLKENIVWRAIKITNKDLTGHYFNFTVKVNYTNVKIKELQNPNSSEDNINDYKVIEANQLWVDYVDSVISTGKWGGMPPQNLNFYQENLLEPIYEIY